LGALQKIQKVVVAANRVPIKIEEQVIGAVATFQDITKIQELEGQIRKKIHHKGLIAKYFFSDIIGKSQSIRETLYDAEKFSKVDSNILIIGETGTGKELVAQSIHNSSNRSIGPFVAVNCAALPPSLLESELFGYVEGAFTGAAKGGKAGLFELAHKGTIFLDEVSEISLDLQGRMLRVLQEREIMRLGDDRIIPVDVRIISATNRNLRKMVAEGKFRQDLLYRLDVLKINVPCLRDRKEDILPLIEYFLNRYNEKFRKNIHCITPDAQNLLIEYEWPGNIRELKNIVERLAVLTVDVRINTDSVKRVIEVDDLIYALSEKSNVKAAERVHIRQRLCDIDKTGFFLFLRRFVFWHHICKK
jgi:transcriptional regulator with PAS, ATPase and Fis domain